MASIYPKKNSPYIWLRYKRGNGLWAGKQTSYRWGNLGEERQAKLLARRQSEIEATRAGLTRASGAAFDAWVLPWLLATYSAASQSATLAIYKRHWRNIQKFLADHDLRAPMHIERKHVVAHLHWRMKSAGRNTAIQEIKFFGAILREACARGLIAQNPYARPGLKRDAAPEKIPWKDAEIAAAARHLDREKSLWMRCAFYCGLYQACRLRQCEIPLGQIRFDLGVIQYPDHLVKGRSGYTQPIDPRFEPILRTLVAEARRKKQHVLCTVPWDASLRLRRTFDRAGLPHLVHHGLRVTWITRAAEQGIPESQAMAFCHHESREVHRIYKKLSAVEIAHVPALMRLPVLSASGVGAGLQPATCDSGVASLSCRKAVRSRVQNRRKSSVARRRNTARDH